VLAMARAMREGDWVQAGAQMFASHDSTKVDYENSTEELDLLVQLVRDYDWRPSDGAGAPADGPPVYGARMSGGGFGGCTVNLIHADALHELGAFLHEHYAAETGVCPTMFATRAATGAQVVESGPGAEGLTGRA